MISIKSSFPRLSAKHVESAESGLKALLARQGLGFTRLAERADLWQSVAERSDELLKSGVREIALLGMGGSSLGPRVLWESYGAWQDKLDGCHFFDNLDETNFFRRLERFKDPTSLHFLIVSKSGSTLETLAMADFLDQFLKDRGSSLAQQSTAISELCPNPLSDWARANSVALLEIPEDVGGRFSVLTPVGLLPAALMGCSLDEIRQGMLWVAENSSLTQQLIAEGLASVQRGDQALYFWPYSQGLETFGAWFQQLWAESLGKEKTLEGGLAPAVPVPVPSLGPRDQHSTLQQVMAGSQPRWVWVLQDSLASTSGPALSESQFAGGEIRVGRKMEDLVSAQSQATQEALVQNGIPTLSLSVAGL